MQQNAKTKGWSSLHWFNQLFTFIENSIIQLQKIPKEQNSQWPSNASILRQLSEYFIQLLVEFFQFLFLSLDIFIIFQTVFNPVRSNTLLLFFQYVSLFTYFPFQLFLFLLNLCLFFQRPFQLKRFFFSFLLQLLYYCVQFLVLLSKFLFLGQLYVLIKDSLSLHFLWKHWTVLPECCLQLWLLNFLAFVFTYFREFHVGSFIDVLKQLVWKTIRHVIPHSFCFQIDRDNMAWLYKMFVCVCILVPTASNTAANHTDPNVSFFFAIIAVGVSLVCFCMVFVVRRWWKFSVDFTLFSVLGKNSACGTIEWWFLGFSLI